MKTSLKLFWVLFGGLFLVSCGGGAPKQQPQPGEKPEANKISAQSKNKPNILTPQITGKKIIVNDGKVSLIMPEGWKNEPNKQKKNNLLHFFAPKADDKFVANISLIQMPIPKAPAGDPPQDVIKSWIDNGVKGLSSMKNFKLISKGLVSLAGKTGFFIESTFTQNNIKVHMIQYGVYKNKAQYFITAGSLDKTFANYKKTFDGVANSLTIK